MTTIVWSRGAFAIFSTASVIALARSSFCCCVRPGYIKTLTIGMKIDYEFPIQESLRRNCSSVVLEMGSMLLPRSLGSRDIVLCDLQPGRFQPRRGHVQDTSALALTFGSTPASQHWNPRYDFGLDGTISLTDVSIEFLQYGSPIVT
jgi:hypothetical protein